MALHENLTNDNNIHFPKGFVGASTNTMPVKTAAGKIEWYEREIMPAASTSVSSIAAPPVETAGKIYLIDNAVGDLTVSAINWQSGTTVRYTFSGSPDLSAVAANDYLICSGAGDSDHDGTFVISTVNDGSDFIEVTNANITDATQDETTGATCNATAAEWDGAPVNAWVKFGALTWESHAPTEGQLCYLTDDDDLFKFSGAAWVSISSGVDTWAEVLVNGATTGGTNPDIQTDKLIFNGNTNIFLQYQSGDVHLDNDDGNIILTNTDDHVFTISDQLSSSGTAFRFDDTGNWGEISLGGNSANRTYTLPDYTMQVVGAKSVNASSLVYLDSSSEGTTDGDLTYDGDEFAHKGATGTNLSVFDGYTTNQNWYEAADRSGLIWFSYSRAGHITLGRPMFNDFYIDGNDGTIQFNGLATEAVTIEDAGSTAATEQDWIEVTVGGVTGYIRVYATK